MRHIRILRMTGSMGLHFACQVVAVVVVPFRPESRSTDAPRPSDATRGPGGLARVGRRISGNGQGWGRVCFAPGPHKGPGPHWGPRFLFPTPISDLSRFVPVGKTREAGKIIALFFWGTFWSSYRKDYRRVPERGLCVGREVDKWELDGLDTCDLLVLISVTGPRPGQGQKRPRGLF